MGTLAQEYLRKMQGFDTRAEIEKEVDSSVEQVKKTATPSDKIPVKAGDVAEAFKKALASLTEEEINAEMAEMSEAEKAAKFPKEKGILKMRALLKKMKAANNDLSDRMGRLQASKSKLKAKANSTPASKNKIKAAKAGLTKQIKKMEAVWDKNMEVSKRANTMLNTLNAEKKAWREKNKKSKE